MLSRANKGGLSRLPAGKRAEERAEERAGQASRPISAPKVLEAALAASKLARSLALSLSRSRAIHVNSDFTERIVIPHLEHYSKPLFNYLFLKRDN